MTVPDSYEPITLDRMEGSKLMDRVDTKYVSSCEVVRRALELASEHYYVLYTGDSPVSVYETLYFDTPGLDMYHMHHNGRLVRTKVRTRAYVNTGNAFLEIKRKNNHRRTRKKRMEIPSGMLADPFAAEGTVDFLKARSGYEASVLAPALSTDFNRITLVSKKGGERITIDFDLRFRNWRNGRTASLGQAVIMELKRSGSITSPMVEILRNLRVHPFRVSKYCIGTALSAPEVKQNRFKEKIRNINKIAYASTDHDAGI